MKMGFPKISSIDVLSKLHQFSLIDVRSESEYLQGHIPESYNSPILNNYERHEVGITYKMKGKEGALQLGYQLVGPFKEQRSKHWKNLIEDGKEALLTCWRGGLRSQIAQEWLYEFQGVEAIRIEGGYKALRRDLIDILKQPFSFIVLAGLTGVGKSKILDRISRPKIDLEKLAQHRGSCFGGFINFLQPQQATFENRLALDLYLQNKAHKDIHKGIIIEDESTRIGALYIPNEIKRVMQISPVIWVEEPISLRVQSIYEEYISAPLKEISPEQLRDLLIKRLSHLKSRLGNVRYLEIEKKLISAFAFPFDPVTHFEWISRLLEYHYDPCYLFAFKKLNRKVLFSGNAKECLEYLQSN